MSELGFHSMSELRRITAIIKQRSMDELQDALAGICKRIPDPIERAEHPMFNAIIREIERRNSGIVD